MPTHYVIIQALSLPVIACWFSLFVDLCKSFVKHFFSNRFKEVVIVSVINCLCLFHVVGTFSL